MPGRSAVGETWEGLMKQRSGPRMSTKRLLLIGIVAVVVVAFGAQLIGRALFAPWSLGWFGRDTLTGSWTGIMQAKQGAQFGLLLELEYFKRHTRNSRSRYGRSRPNLQGRATICTPTGERYDYEVSGFASPFGNVERLYVEYGDPKLSALNLRLSGEWEAPVLRLQSDANPFMPDGRFLPTRVLSGDDPGDSFAPIELRKGTLEDLAACKRAR
jgi:hypothetical protein